MQQIDLIPVLKNNLDSFHTIVPFDGNKEKLLLLDFTASNLELTDEILGDTVQFANYVNNKLHLAGCKFGIGGYGEHRTIYNRSNHFDSPTPGEEPRRVHLGIDIWGPVHTPVMAPLNGIVHSLAFNNNFGDYGATIILSHNLEGCIFHTLYGHLSMDSLKDLNEGDWINKGDIFAEFGMQFENGHWPPHLHFQIIIDMEGKSGDYPGVCKYSEREIYMANCLNPDLMLPMLKWI